MNTKRVFRKLSCAILLYAATACGVLAAETTTTVGMAYTPNGSVAVYVRETDGVRWVEISAIDRYAVNKVFIRFTPEQFAQLQKLLSQAEAAAK